MPIDEVGTEHKLRHAHGVGGVSRGFGCALAGLIAVAEVGVLHVEVTLARRDVHWLAGAATGKMNRRSHLRKLDEIDQILERGVATTAV